MKKDISLLTMHDAELAVEQRHKETLDGLLKQPQERREEEARKAELERVAMEKKAAKAAKQSESAKKRNDNREAGQSCRSGKNRENLLTSFGR